MKSYYRKNKEKWKIFHRSEKEVARRREYQKTEAFKRAQEKYVRSGKKAAWERKKNKEDSHFRIKKRISARMRISLRSRNAKKGRSVFDLLPYTLEELMAHLAAQFQDGMTWDNYGEWHIDHIIPDSHFKYASVKDEGFLKAWALNNLQPLWAEDNLKKSNKIVHTLALN